MPVLKASGVGPVRSGALRTPPRGSHRRRCRTRRRCSRRGCRRPRWRRRRLPGRRWWSGTARGPRPRAIPGLGRRGSRPGMSPPSFCTPVWLPRAAQGHMEGCTIAFCPRFLPLFSQELFSFPISGGGAPFIVFLTPPLPTPPTPHRGPISLGIALAPFGPVTSSRAPWATAATRGPPQSLAVRLLPTLNNRSTPIVAD